MDSTTLYTHKIRPPFRWIGGKSRMLYILLRYIPKTYGMYYEPFLGAGAMLLALQPKKG